MSDRRTMRALVIAIVVGAVVNLAGSGLFVWSSYEARRHNCALVEDAFDGYTAGLLKASSDGPPTPAEQAELDRKVGLLNETYKPILAGCK